jgi:hypothetical protein
MATTVKRVLFLTAPVSVIRKVSPEMRGSSHALKVKNVLVSAKQ